MRIMITSGSTFERIDSVRGISNISTGRLGSLIADAFSDLEDIEEIYYLCNKTAMLPQSQTVNIINIDTVSDLENTITDILSRVHIDIVIHGMAVSDYSVTKVTSISDIARSLVGELSSLKGKQIDEEMLISLLNTSVSKSSIDDAGKISSNFDDLLLLMGRTAKVISLFHKISPTSILVGFKLLDTVSQEVLIDTGFKLLQENGCNFVLANDLGNISAKSHVGYLIDSEKKYQRLGTKREIADAIVKSTMEEKGRQK